MLPLRGTVGAGSSVVQFPLSKQVKELYLPLLPYREEDLDGYFVSGSSLEGDRIFDGDVLVVLTRFEHRDVKSNRVAVVRLYGSELYAKHVVFEVDGQTATLYSCGGSGGYSEVQVAVEEIEVLGLVVLSARPGPGFLL